MFSFGPDDIAPGVCATCISARMAVLMVGAVQRVARGATQPMSDRLMPLRFLIWTLSVFGLGALVEWKACHG